MADSRERPSSVDVVDGDRRAEAERSGQASGRADGPGSISGIRDGDMQPYVGLRYLSRLFKLMALVIVLMIFAELVSGLSEANRMPVSLLVVDISRWVVIAGLLWGAGDLATLMIDVGHDVRATRLMLGRQAAQQVVERPSGKAQPRASVAEVADVRKAPEQEAE